MNVALLKDTRKTDRARGGKAGEFLRVTPPPDTTFALSRWENEGGSPLLAPGLEFTSRPLLGTASQIEWAGSIRERVNDEFDRVATSFRSIAHRQSARKRNDTEAIIAILEDKRVEVLGREQAGYFIRDWQEISDQVRQMIAQDSRYQAIKVGKSADNSLTGGR